MNKPETTPAKTKTEFKNYISNPFKLIFDGFSNLFKYNQNLAIILLIVGLLGAVGQFGNPFAFAAPPAETTSSGSAAANEPLAAGAVAAILIVVGIILLILLPIIVFISTMYAGIAAYVALKTAEQKTVTFNEAFKVTLKKFWTILWLEIIVFFKVFGGLLLFIIPGIRASLRYNMVVFPVFDKNATAKEAIDTSKSITKNHLIEVFGMVTAASLIPFVSPIMQIGGQSLMYPQLRDLKASGAAKPKVHWLNYLGFILVAIVLIFISLIFLLVTIIANNQLTNAPL